MVSLPILRTALKITTIQRALTLHRLVYPVFSMQCLIYSSNNLWGRHCCDPHCTEGETGAQRGSVTCPTSLSR